MSTDLFPRVRNPEGKSGPGGCPKCGGYWQTHNADEWCLNCGEASYRTPGIGNSDEGPHSIGPTKRYGQAPKYFP